MKTRYFILFIVLLSLNMACFHTDDGVSPNDPEQVDGSTEMITETRTLQPFHSIAHSTVGTVYIAQGNEQKVEVKVNANLLQYVKTSVSNKQLHIYLDYPGSVSNLKLTVYITMSDLKQLITGNTGAIVGESRFTADDVQLDVSSAGYIEIEIEANKLYSNLSSAGNLYLSGNIDTHRANISSAGNLQAFSLETANSYITVSSAGNGFIYVTNYLNATLSSVGNLFYKGHPTIQSSITSLGRLIDSN